VTFRPYSAIRMVSLISIAEVLNTLSLYCPSNGVSLNFFELRAPGALAQLSNSPAEPHVTSDAQSKSNKLRIVAS